MVYPRSAPRAGWVAAALAAVALSAPAAPAPDTEIPWKEDTEDPTLISLGPVGARVKTDHLVKGCADSQSRSGVVKYIFRNSPADGKLQLEDEVTGVNGQPFDKDFSRRMGAAIDWSEGNSGRLVLDIRRGGKPLKVAFDLPKIGSYSSTFPNNCKKSDLILEAACDWLARHQWPNGRLEGDRNSGYCVCTAVGGLAFLGNGNPKYAKNIELIVKNFLEFFTKTRTPDGHFGPTTLEGWQLMYGTMFLGEYDLATRDPRIPPLLQYLNREIEHLQYRTLEPEILARMNAHLGATEKNRDPLVPPYWFAHMRPSLTTIGGYMHLGANVANALVAWGLLAECGVAVDRDNFEKTQDYVQVACPSGEMAYAPWPNQRGGDSDAFGRTGVLAVAYRLQKDRPEYTAKIAAALKRHCETDYYISHSSAVMGKAWGTLGLAALDPELLRQALDRFRYDYSLIRLHDGRFVSNPAHWAQEGHPQCDLRGAYGNGHRWTTAFNALIFTLARGKLRIAGGGAAGTATAWPSPFKPKPVADAAGSDDTARTESKPTAPPRKPASAEALKEWDGKLKAAVAARLQAGARPTFIFSAVGGPAEIVSLDAKGEMKLNAAGSALFFSWTTLKLDDKRALASGLAAAGEPGDVALAAFYCLAAGDEKAAEPHLRRLGEKERAALDSAFQ